MQLTSSTSSHTVLLLALKVPTSCMLHIPHELYNLICCYSYSHLDLETDPSTAVNGETLSQQCYSKPKSAQCMEIMVTVSEE